MTVLDVIEAFEPTLEAANPPAEGHPARPVEDPGLDRLRGLFDEVDGLARRTYASVTLEALAGHRSVADPRLHVVK